MREWRLIYRAVVGPNLPQTIRVDVETMEAIVAWGIQAAGGVATVSAGFVDEGGTPHNIYRNAAALAAAEPGTVIGQWSRGATDLAAPQFGAPPRRLSVDVTAPGVALTTTVEIWGYVAD